MPRLHMTFRQFHREVKLALESLPATFLPWMKNLAIDVKERPTRADYAKLDPSRPSADIEDEGGGDLLGLFDGVAVTDQSYGMPEPNRITIFRRPLEARCRNAEELRLEIQNTVIHELAHHFGFDEDDLEAFERHQEEKRARLFGPDDEPAP